MSDAKKCDRCGRVYEMSNKARIIFEYFPRGVGKTKNSGDICPECAAKFNKWWNKKRKGARDEA